MRLSWIAPLVAMAGGVTLALAAPDPFSPLFDAGFVIVAAAVAAVTLRGLVRLSRSVSRARRVLGRVMLAGWGLVVAVVVLLFHDHRLVVFRRGDAETWRRDLMVLRGELHRLPAGLREARGAAAEAELDVLERSLSSLDEDARQAGLTRAVAALADGHSIAFPFLPSTDFALVPIRIAPFDDGWFVTAAAHGHRDLAGARAVSINGIDIAQVYAAVAPYVSADNADSRRSRAAIYLLSPGLVRVATGRGRDELELGIQRGGAAPETVTLAPRAPWRYLLWSFDPRSYERRAWWLTEYRDRGAVVASIRSIRNDGERTLSAFAEHLLASARRIGARRIIIDVRGNMGGDNTLFGGFVSTLAASEFNAADRLFVLIDAGTFSAATNLVSSLDARTAATLVGSPTGAGPNHFGDPRLVRLPETRAMLFLSTRYHQFGRADDRRVAHEPAWRVPQLSGDYFAGRDAALETVLAAR